MVFTFAVADLTREFSSTKFRSIACSPPIGHLETKHRGTPPTNLLHTCITNCTISTPAPPPAFRLTLLAALHPQNVYDQVAQPYAGRCGCFQDPFPLQGTARGSRHRSQTSRDGRVPNRDRTVSNGGTSRVDHREGDRGCGLWKEGGLHGRTAPVQVAREAC